MIICNLTICELLLFSICPQPNRNPHFREDFYLAGALGVEPSSKVLETFILPMYYAPLLANYNTISYVIQVI